MLLLCRIVAWGLAGTIIVLSVVPASDRPSTPVAHDLEHFLIFFATGLAFAVGYRDRLAIVTAWLLVFCGAVELVQLGVPGRHARLQDFLVDLAATYLGVIVTLAATRILTEGPRS
jgi:VanZ family protein